MTPEEAELWAKDSVVKDVVHHNTDSFEKVQGILNDGFRPGEGAAYGRGVYTSTAEEHGYGGYNLQMRINIKNPIDYHDGIWNKADDWYLKRFGRTAEAADLESSDLLAKYCQAMGHDALRVHWEPGSLRPTACDWYVVFDKKNMAIIKYPKNRISW
jgi:hypothetical protein